MSSLANYIRNDINYCQQFFKVIYPRYADATAAFVDYADSYITMT